MSTRQTGIEKVSVAISSELLRAVRGAVASGNYASTSEVMREALREWKARRENAQAATPGNAVYPLNAARRQDLQLLCARFGVKRLALFGSVLRADFDATRSDLDVAVEFDSVSAATARDYFLLKSALEGLFGRTVDLVELSSMQDSRLKRIIERSQVQVYERGEAT
jgi:uncharacterized protein